MMRRVEEEAARTAREIDKEVHSLKEQKSEAQKAFQRLIEETPELNRENSDLNSRNAELNIEAAELNGEDAELNRQNTELNTTLAGIFESNSWRLTAPCVSSESADLFPER